jgi:hypothetical protein
MVATDIVSGRHLRLWGPELKICPFDTGPGSLFIAYYASAEVSCMLALDWPVPTHLLDLYAEFRLITNGRPTVAGSGLLGAMTRYRLPHLAPKEKQALRARILAGPPFSRAEKINILDYCASDVEALAALLPRMEPEICSSPTRFGQALLRGRYMRAAAAAERVGVPIDMPLLASLRTHWRGLQRLLIDDVDAAYGVYEDGHFREARFLELVRRRGWGWPMLPTGKPMLDAETFRSMSALHPELDSLRQLRNTLGEMRLNDLAIGRDRRNRVLLSAFKTKTSRNAPSSSRFVFGPSTWLRFLIKPEPGTALAYIDWSSQELAIAAALSGDNRLTAAVQTGDPYLAFATAARLAPPGATKTTDGLARDRVKACVLGVGYGMGAPTLAARLGVPVCEADMLLRLFDETYPVFARWRRENLDRALLGLSLSTVFGWELHVDAATKPNTLRNFPAQGNGAEMMRLAVSLGIERAVQICCPVHDALLIEARESEIDGAVATMRAAMDEASQAVLGGMVVRTDTKIVRYPDRYTDPRGLDLYNRIIGLLNRLEPGTGRLAVSGHA